MERRTVRDIAVLLPDLDEDYLDPIDEPPDDELFENAVGAGEWTDHRMRGGRIEGSRLTGVAVRGAEWTRVRLVNSVFEQCDLSAGRWAAMTLERVEFRGCRMTGLKITGTKLKNVIFENCRLDYVTLVEATAAGAVAFVDCVLTNAELSTCVLTDVVLDGCALDQLALDACDLSGADLRGSEVSGVTGLSSLRGARVTYTQLIQVAEVAARDLALRIED